MKAPERSTEHTKTWCGPYALAMLAGLSYDEAYPRIRHSIRRFRGANVYHVPEHIQGVYSPDMLAAAKTLGVKLQFKRAKNWPTLGKFRDMMKPGRWYLVQITGHYLVVDTRNWTWCDNGSRGWLPLDNCRWLRSHVELYSEAKPRD